MMKNSVTFMRKKTIQFDICDATKTQIAHVCSNQRKLSKPSPQSVNETYPKAVGIAFSMQATTLVE